jgi:hypothetical protein
MAVADFYARGAVAASQVLAGFDEPRFRATLEDVRLAIAFGADAANSREGSALLDLLVRLLSRLYPTLILQPEHGADRVASELSALARGINPEITLAGSPTIRVVVGSLPATSGSSRQIFVGSDGWNALVSTNGPRKIGASNNPLGAGVAASLAAANVFRLVFLGDRAELDADVVASILGRRHDRETDPNIRGDLGELVLVGVGAIGNAAAWALSRTPAKGILHLVDHQEIDLGNLQRYVLADRSDEGHQKVRVAARRFDGPLRVQQHAEMFSDFVSTNGYSWPRMLLALDSARDRRAAQASLPGWVANAWTQPGDLGVSVHDFRNGACVSCLYLPEHALQNEDGIVAAALGVPDRLLQVRGLLHTGQGVPRDLLEAIAAARLLPLDALIPFEGVPVRNLYVEGFCGGAVLPLGQAGTPHQDVHVPLAHQSALAGVLLATSAVRDVLEPRRSRTEVTRVNLLRPLANHLTQPAAKDARGICICQDPDYRRQYDAKYPRSSESR